MDGGILKQKYLNNNDEIFIESLLNDTEYYEVDHCLQYKNTST